MEHAPLTLLNDIGLSILFAALAGNRARAARQPTILGYVLGGVLPRRGGTGGFPAPGKVTEGRAADG